MKNRVRFQKLLNFDLSNEEVEKIICDTNFRANSIDEFNSNFWGSLIKHNKLSFNWHNVFKYYNEYGLDELLIKFINRNVLNEEQEDFIDITRYKEVYFKMFDEVLINNDINDISVFERIISPELKCEKLNVLNVNIDKIKSIIRYDSLVFNKENFDFINSNYKSILAYFIKENIDKYIANIDMYEIDYECFGEILNENNISDGNKLAIVNYANTHEFEIKDENIAFVIAKIVTKHSTEIKLETIFRQSILDFSLGNEMSIKLLSSQYEIMSDVEIITILKKMGGEYERITIPYKHPVIEDNKLNNELAHILEKRGIISSSSKIKKGLRINNRVKFEN